MEQHFGCFLGVAFIEGLFCTQTVHLGPGFLDFGRFIGVAFIERLFCTQTVHLDLGPWPLYRGGLYSGVAVKRGSTVVVIHIVGVYLQVLCGSGIGQTGRQQGLAQRWQDQKEG